MKIANYYFACIMLLLTFKILRVNGTTVTLLNRNIVTYGQSNQVCKNGQSTTVTKEINAAIYVLSNTRTNFNGNRWNRRMEQLDRESKDEKGHIIASSFGGPAEEWNLVPQDISINRKINAQSSILNRWDEVEKWIRDQVKKNAVPVTYKISIVYSNQNGCRPTHFKISATNPRNQGIKGEFDNGPYGSFAISSNGSKNRPRKP
ncbi:uncharacterized protein LOC126833929 [Adelges cooleyi]|uniref:uncharacterized protein LOC126833929 n=1 Tax=Adelges cooleyi TaxID=133065 RepID=UPI00217F44C9|nr:uncharacterized protein LOC126833929 [Adelges cooleyi]